MQRLFVHIGTHKTGTTSLQAYLFDHREQLRRDGVAVCTEGHRKFGETANCFALAHSVLRPTLMTISKMTGDARRPGFRGKAKSFAQIARFLSDASAAKFILSAEALCFARDEAELNGIKRLLCRQGIEVIPIVCFRDGKAWRDSWFAQIAKYEKQFRHSHGHGSDDIRGDWYFDKDKILRFWREVGPVRVIDFDHTVGKHGTVVPTMLEAMGIRDHDDVENYFLNTGR